MASPSQAGTLFMSAVLLSNAACWFGLVTMGRLCLRLMPGAAKPVSGIRPAVAWSGLAIGSIIPVGALVLMSGNTRGLQAVLAWPLLAAVPLGIAYARRRRMDRAAVGV